MKTLLAVVALVILALGAFTLWSPGEMGTDNEIKMSEMSEGEVAEETSQKTAVEDGSYVVVAEDSKVNWAGKKPLIDGYVNKGYLAVSGGQIEVSGDKVSGNFTIDMNSLSVSDTPTKPGKESALEGHLKSENWFDVEQFPEASFVITQTVQSSDSNSGGNYVVTGDLTMKGVTDEITFPANVYLNDSGSLVADASFEFDRTKWGITSGSGSFFDNLADNVIDDMVALSFVLVAEKQ